MTARGATAALALPVPFVDLKAQHDELRPQIDAAIRDLIDRSAFVGGAAVEAFEHDFAAFIGTRHGVGVSDGTEAVKLALQSVGVGRDDAIVTVSHTFIGTVEGAVQLGAVPLFVDVDARTRTMSPAALEAFLAGRCERRAGELRHRASGRRVGAIVPVHLYGQTCDMEPILALAAAAGVPVIEDAAQAHGATCRFRDGSAHRCGSMGIAGAFSFYPGKNLGAMGEAGALVTSNADVARRARMLRQHGEEERYVHLAADGGNGRLDAIQAAVLGIKLTRLDAWNARRVAIAARYRELLAGSGVELPVERAGERHVYHLFVVGVADRDRVRAALADEGIATGVHYPVPLHLQPAFAGAALDSPLPETERLAASCVSLPMYPHLEDEQIERVADALIRATR